MSNTTKIFLLLEIIGLLGSSLSAHAQEKTAAINGYIVDAATQETMVGATVYIKDRKIGTYTNKSGFFAIPAVPEGKQIIVVKFVGYDVLEKEITVRAGE